MEHATPSPSTGARRLLVVASPMTEMGIFEVFERLHGEGVELVFAEGRRPGRLPESFLGRPGVSVASMPLERTGPETSAIRAFRLGIGMLPQMKPDARRGQWTRQRATAEFFERIYLPVPPGAGTFQLPNKSYRKLAQWSLDLERLLPPHPELVDAVRDVAPDAVFILTRCGKNSVELDVIKACRVLGIPNAALVHSWDNLSSKAVLSEHPDELWVWNEKMVWEAAKFHRIPRERVVVLGAAILDRLFELVEALTPAEPGGRLLYLGSAPQIAKDESGIFADWLQAIRSSRDPALRSAPVDVRPHPANKSLKAAGQDDALVTVHPSKKLDQEAILAMIDGASAAVGLNTTAQIEAAVAGRPVLTFRAGDRAPGQEGTLHFTYLLEENGGFVIDAPNLEEHVAALSRVLAGEHDLEPTRRFVEQFLRPLGVDRPVQPMLAERLLELVGGRASAA